MPSTIDTRREDPEPHHRIERTEAGEADVQDHVRLPEAVEALGGGAGEECDREDQEEHRLRADVTAARNRRCLEIAERARPLLRGQPPKAGLRHRERGEDRERRREHSARDHRQPEIDAGDRNAQPDADERAGVAELLPAREHATDSVDPDLVGDPRLLGAARERVAEAPDRPAREHGRDVVDGAGQHEPQAHHRPPDHEREPARVRVGDDTGRNLEDEDRELHRGPHEHELERVHADVLHEVDGTDREGDGEGEREPQLARVVDGRRRKASHRSSGSGAPTFTISLRRT